MGMEQTPDDIDDVVGEVDIDLEATCEDHTTIACRYMYDFTELSAQQE